MILGLYNMSTSDRNIYPLTHKQIQYLITLYSKSTIDILILDFCSTTLGRSCSWNTIYHKDFKILLRAINKSICISDKQIQSLQDKYKGISDTELWSYLSYRLGRPITKYTDMTHHDVMILFKGNNRFKLYTIDYQLYSTDRVEYGYQYSKLCKDSKMYYLKFFDMMMLDYDKIEYDVLLSYFKDTPYTIKIYKSYNGYHVFVLSHILPHNSRLSYAIMESLRCDPYYCLFSYKYGYKVRLSPKLGRDEGILYNEIGTIGNKVLDCHTPLISLHDQYIESTHPIDI